MVCKFRTNVLWFRFISKPLRVAHRDLSNGCVALNSYENGHKNLRPADKPYRYLINPENSTV